MSGPGGASLPGAAHGTAGRPARTRLDGLAIAAALAGSAAIAGASLVAGVAYRGVGGQPYSPANHFVSELGELGVSALAPVFNLALVLAGCCYLVLMTGLARSVRSPLRLLALPPGLAAGLGGIAVGAIPMGSGGPHVLAAAVFFNAGWLAVALASLAFLHRPDPRFPRPLALLGALTVAAFLAFLAIYPDDPLVVASRLDPAMVRPAVWPSAAVEWLAVGGMTLWTALLGHAWRRETR